MAWQSMAATRELQRLGNFPCVLTIGNFDGVHSGHQYLLAEVSRLAEEHQVRSLAITFEPHPIQILRPEAPFYRITSAATKRKMLVAAGIDDVAVIHFDREFSQLSPLEFLDLLCACVSPLAIFVGEGFRFGSNRSGDGTTIQEYARQHGFTGLVIKRLENGDEIISSSSVRAALLRGDVEQAATALGRRFRIQGSVQAGVARGRELGYPTANLETAADQLLPADGIYAAYARVHGNPASDHEAMIYIGSSPTFEGSNRQLEAHLLDFSGDLYASELCLEFVAFIRPDMVFDDVDSLVRQIEHDEISSREALRMTTPEYRERDQ